MIRQVSIFTGRVQGVGFRMTVQRLARGYAVTGWVRNEPDGSVRAEIQGEAEQVRSLLDAIHGRLGSNIVARSDQEMVLVPGEAGFDIR